MKKLTGPEYFNKTEVPAPEEFYNALKKEGITLKNWHHVKDVWEKFECVNFGEYHDIYLLTDVLLLADVFEAFRDFCLEQYGLDPVHYTTLPSFAWDALLKTTDVELELDLNRACGYTVPHLKNRWRDHHFCYSMFVFHLFRKK